jgi:hypothetical protein
MIPPMPQLTPNPRHRTGAATQSAIKAKIERSSFGTADARAMRARTSTADAHAVVARAAAIPHRTTGKATSGTSRKTRRGSGG